MIKKCIVLFIYVLICSELFSQTYYTLERKNENAFTKVEAPSLFKNKTLLNKVSTATFDVTFNSNFNSNTEAKTAFNYALDIWKHLISSNVTIKIDAKMQDLGNSNTLAQCRPADYREISNVLYPIALAEKINNTNMNGSEFDIEVIVNSNSGVNAYYGLDGNTPAGKTDFVSTILHEITHGLGFAHSFDYSSGIGSWGSNGKHLPFDEGIVTNISSNQLINTQNYSNPSSDLGDALTSNNIFFYGQNARYMNGNSNPKMFAPTTWKSGSSISHLDEDTFPAGNSNSLMTPELAKAEAIHSPGEVTIGILQDMGWDVNRVITITSPKSNDNYYRGQTLSINWSDSQTLSVGITLVDLYGNPVHTIEVSESSYLGIGNNYNWSIPNSIPVGAYQIKIHDVGLFNSGISLSFPFNITNTPIVATPVFSPPYAEFDNSIDIEITCPTDGAIIYYTLDETTPTQNSLQYTGAITVSSTTHILARAYKSGYQPSNIVVGNFSKSGLELVHTLIYQTRAGLSYGTFYGPIYYWTDQTEDWNYFSNGVGEIYPPESSDIVIRGTNDSPSGTTLKFQSMVENHNGSNISRKYNIHNEYEVMDKNYKDDYEAIMSYLDYSHNATISVNLEGTENYPGSIVQFKDPWYIDEGNSSYYDSQYGKYKNFGVSSSLPWLQKQSPFNPSRTSEHKGVFLEQIVETNKPYYSIRVPETQTLTINSQNYTFNFFDWTVSDAELITPTNKSGGYVSTPVVFGAADATVKANYKGLHLSSNPSAFTNNNQRKFIRTSNGYLHLVYESLGKVWYEKSTDNGNTWTIMNGGNPISSSDAKNPSIDEYDNIITVTYQEKAGNYYGIIVAFLYADGSIISENVVTDLVLDSYSNDADPVIAWNYDSRLCVVWKMGGNLYYRFGRMNQFTPGSAIYWFGSTKTISGTNSSSINPTISTCHTSGTSVYHLAWQQGTTAIKYCSLTADASNNITVSSIETPSSGSGYTYNRCPSFDYASTNSVSLVWIGENYWGNYYNQIVKRVRTTSWASSFSNFGSELVDVYSPTISSVGFIAWRESANTDKCFRWGSIKTIDTNGEYLQLCEATSSSNVYAMSYDIGSPNQFDLSSTITSLSKETDSYPVSGRKCIVTTDQSEYYFGINNVSIDGDDISFSSLPEDNIEISRENITDYFMTEPFSLESESEIIFNYRVGITDTLVKEQIAEKAEDISFRVYLVDADNSSELQTLEVIKAKELKKEKDNHTTISFKIGKISSKQARLAFMPVTNSKYEYTLANLYTTKDGLQKSEVIDISYKDEISIDQFNLEPNYPNPFNPTTTIRYQIPNASHVVLKVYDMLGKEVATLVNKNQANGRYEVNFDASRLASGTYIYRIEAGSYTKAHKMILLK